MKSTSKHRAIRNMLRRSMLDCLRVPTPTKHFFLAAIVVLAASTVSAQDASPQPLSELSLDLDSLRSWKTKTYSYQAASPGKSEKTNVGTITLKTLIKDDHIILDDEMSLTFRGEVLKLQLRHVCQKNNFLPPIRIESTGEGSDEVSTFVVTVDGNEATVRRDGKERKFTLPQDTVTFWALMRLVTMLPRPKGTVVTFDHWLESEELNQKRKFRVESLGHEPIELGDTKVSCTKFQLEGGGNLPRYYWIDDAGVLQQMLLDDRKLIRLQDEAED